MGCVYLPLLILSTHLKDDHICISQVGKKIRRGRYTWTGFCFLITLKMG